MSNLLELKESLPLSLNRSQHDPVRDFFVPALSRAQQYDVGVGFFTSAWLRLAARGIAELVSNGGTARLVVSCMLQEEDWDAMKNGGREVGGGLAEAKLLRDVDAVERSLESETRNTLGWLIHYDRLLFKVAVMSSKRGIFHAKFGVVSDADGNAVAFDGSYNLTGGAEQNWENINLYRSWEPSDVPRLDEHRLLFERIWRDQEPDLHVYNMGSSVTERIVRTWRGEAPDFAKAIEESARTTRKQPECTIVLRDYQETAVNKWFKNGCRGILAMATGTGKTFTALACAKRLLETDPKLLVVCCPYIHLVEQWKREASRFGFDVLSVHSQSPGWRIRLKEMRRAARLSVPGLRAIVTTYSSYAKSLRGLLGHAMDMMFIADEVHHAGAPGMRKCLPDQASSRLGLSATPTRHMDDRGSAQLLEYFGGIAHEITLEQAILELGVLTPYKYIPVVVELNDSELGDYRVLSEDIAALYAQLEEDESPFDHPLLRGLMLRRMAIVNNASAKLPALGEVLRRRGRVSKALVYTSPEMLDATCELLSKMGVRSSRFTYRESARERESLLKLLGDGTLDALTAIRCLDEGVDVPVVEEAFILCSASNPKEWVQRRGRILRKAVGKREATIYDFLTVPRLSPDLGEMDKDEFELERRLLSRELKRFGEFARTASNNAEARAGLMPIADAYGMPEIV